MQTKVHQRIHPFLLTKVHQTRWRQGYMMLKVHQTGQQTVQLKVHQA